MEEESELAISAVDLHLWEKLLTVSVLEEADPRQQIPACLFVWSLPAVGYGSGGAMAAATFAAPPPQAPLSSFLLSALSRRDCHKSSKH